MVKARHSCIILISALLMFLPVKAVRGTINSISLTVENPTVLSNGLGYYLAGKMYTFTVNLLDPDITGWAQLTDVRITVANTPNVIVSINPSGTGVNLPVTVVSGSVNAVADVTGSFNNCTVTFKVTFRWDTPSSIWAAARTIQASGTTTNTRTTSRLVSYGVASSIRVLNFAQNGVAADAMVNPWHDAFNVSGVLAYDVPGTGLADRLETVDPGEVTGTVLYLDGNATGMADGDATVDGLNYTVTAGLLNTVPPVLGNRSWNIRASMTTAGATEASSNSLILNCDRVEITGIAFMNGGGVDAPSYYRAVTVPGTQVRVTVRMQNGGGAVIGNTTITLRNITEGAGGDVNVLIANGQTSGVGDALNPTVTAGTTELNTYRVQDVTGGSYGGDTLPNGQSDETRVQQPANPQVYWDNGDPPGSDTGTFTGWVGLSQTTSTLTFNWSPLTGAAPDGDFYSYRIYYRTSAVVSPPAPAGDWLLIDRNVASFASLGTVGTSTVTISNLRPVTNYDYYIVAVDVFGNEVPAANRLFFVENPPPPPAYGTASTVASSIIISLTDGITSYNDNSFTLNPLASARPLRKTSIRVSMFIVGVGDLPDTVNVIGIPNIVDPVVNGSVFSGTGLAGVVGTDYYRYESRKVGANEWTAYIPDSSPLVVLGANSGFILELVRGGVTSYVDHDSEAELPPGFPNDGEWTFNINSAPVFTPWPTRILNNVITDRNPLAYPAFYLTDDAYVTIKAYDIKGRPVSTILDGAYRKGGQNIKEGGWAGSNRSGKRLGPGLYYINIKAKRASDGRVILNDFEKVVVAR